MVPLSEGDEVTVDVRLVFYEPGFFTGVVNKSTELEAVVSIIVGGGITDIISVRVAVPPDITTPTAGQRIRAGANYLGRATGRFVEDSREGS